MTNEQIKKLMQYGDYGLVARMLGITADATRMRFYRNDDKVKKAMIKIIKNREALIKKTHISTKNQ